MVAIYKVGIIPQTLYVIMILNLCIPSDNAFYLYQVSRKYLKGFQRICILNFGRGHNSVKRVGEVMVLVLSTSSNNALYLYQV